MKDNFYEEAACYIYLAFSSVLIGCSSQFKSGDAFSNDGDTTVGKQISITTFKSDWLKNGFIKEVDGLYWEKGYNATDEDAGLRPEFFRKVTPFGSDSQSEANERVRQVIITYNPTYVRPVRSWPGFNVDMDKDGKNETITLSTDANQFLYWSYTLTSSGKAYRIQLGLANDMPFVGDFDGNGNQDFATQRIENGLGYWYILLDSKQSWSAVSNDSALSRRVQWGLAKDIPMVNTRPKRKGTTGQTQTYLGVWRLFDGAPAVYLVDAMAGSNPWNDSSLWSKMPLGLPGDIPSAPTSATSQVRDIFTFRSSDGYMYRGRFGGQTTCNECVAEKWQYFFTLPAGGIEWGNITDVIIYRKSFD